MKMFGCFCLHQVHYLSPFSDAYLIASTSFTSPKETNGNEWNLLWFLPLHFMSFDNALFRIENWSLFNVMQQIGNTGSQIQPFIRLCLQGTWTHSIAESRHLVIVHERTWAKGDVDNYLKKVGRWVSGQPWSTRGPFLRNGSHLLLKHPTQN